MRLEDKDLGFYKGSVGDNFVKIIHKGETMDFEKYEYIYFNVCEVLTSSQDGVMICWLSKGRFIGEIEFGSGRDEVRWFCIVSRTMV